MSAAANENAQIEPMEQHQPGEDTVQSKHRSFTKNPDLKKRREVRAKAKPHESPAG
jgi:hypothetical protein